MSLGIGMSPHGSPLMQSFHCVPTSHLMSCANSRFHEMCHRNWLHGAGLDLSDALHNSGCGFATGFSRIALETGHSFTRLQYTVLLHTCCVV